MAKEQQRSDPRHFPNNNIKMSKEISKGEKIPNTIHGDSIWRQTIKFETETAAQYRKNWGFIQDAIIENV
jgi:hypothetical protein